MPTELCITKDALLQSPQAGLTYPSIAQEISPFTMNGAPLTVPPQPIKGITEYKRLEKATKDTSNMTTYFVQDNYYLINIATENILGADTNTSLRFKNENYTLNFAAIHSAIWATSGIQVSLVFVNANGHFYHICIPITFDGTAQTANPFLNAWLTQSKTLPTGFTMNQILNFGTPKTPVKFATLEYCLLYNYGKILKPYTFCIFQTPLKVVQSTLPSWLANDLDLRNPQTLPSPQASFQTYRRKSFDEIFNLFMRGVIPVYIYKTADPYLIGTEQHFDSKKTQNSTNPAYFQVTSKLLSGANYSLYNTESGNVARGLKNIKCYPIDLVTQIDSDGNIFIDEKTNKPVNVKDVVVDDIFNPVDSSGSGMIFDISENNIKLANFYKTQTNIRFIIAFSIIFLLIASIVIVLVVYIFRGVSFGSAPVVTVPPPMNMDPGPLAAGPLAPGPLAPGPLAPV